MYKMTIFCVAALIACVLAGGYFYGTNRYKAGYDKGYSAGYSAGYEDRNKLVSVEIADAVAAHSKVETKIVYQKVPYTGADVQVKTEPPVVTVEVNGKQQQIQQHSETADLAVKTETAVKIKIPERRWVFGLGTDGKKPAFLLKAPVKGALGVWVAGSTNKKIMGGLTVSF